jgi:hypothetical protein
MCNSARVPEQYCCTSRYWRHSVKRRHFKPGQEISMRFASEPDAYTYISLIAYLEFRLKQIENNKE